MARELAVNLDIQLASKFRTLLAQLNQDQTLSPQAVGLWLQGLGYAADSPELNVLAELLVTHLSQLEVDVARQGSPVPPLTAQPVDSTQVEPPVPVSNPFASPPANVLARQFPMTELLADLFDKVGVSAPIPQAQEESIRPLPGQAPTGRGAALAAQSGPSETVEREFSGLVNTFSRLQQALASALWEPSAPAPAQPAPTEATPAGSPAALALPGTLDQDEAAILARLVSNDLQENRQVGLVLESDFLQRTGLQRAALLREPQVTLQAPPSGQILPADWPEQAAHDLHQLAEFMAAPGKPEPNQEQVTALRAVIMHLAQQPTRSPKLLAPVLRALGLPLTTQLEQTPEVITVTWAREDVDVNRPLPNLKMLSARVNQAHELEVRLPLPTPVHQARQQGAEVSIQRRHVVVFPRKAERAEAVTDASLAREALAVGRTALARDEKPEAAQREAREPEARFEKPVTDQAWPATRPTAWAPTNFTSSRAPGETRKAAEAEESVPGDAEDTLSNEVVAAAFDGVIPITDPSRLLEYDPRVGLAVDENTKGVDEIIDVEFISITAGA